MNLLVITVFSVLSCFSVVSIGEESSVPFVEGEQAAPTTGVKDPAVPSAKIIESLEMIRRVEKAEKLVAEVERLRRLNAQLNKELKKETRSLPLITVKSKAISATDAMVILDVGGQKRRVRQDLTVLVSINKEEATPLLVKQIKPDIIEIEFPDFQHTLILNE